MNRKVTVLPCITKQSALRQNILPQNPLKEPTQLQKIDAHFFIVRNAKNAKEVRNAKRHQTTRLRQLAPDSPLREFLHEFLRRNEWRHLQMSALFVPQYHEAAKQQKQFTLPNSMIQVFEHSISADLTAEKQRQKIAFLLLWTEHGRLLFDGTELRDNSYLPVRELKNLLKTHKTRQFIGTQSQYQFLERIHPFYFSGHFARREYWIMLRKNQSAISRTGKNPPLDKIDRKLQIRQLTQADLGQLFPLEWAYYQEEVIQNPINRSHDFIIKKNCIRRLEQFLQYGIFCGSELVARAMINAYGLDYWQLGGFYTAPRWRGKGLGGILLQKLCAVIEEAGRSAMLFVRQDNPSALHLYQKYAFAIAEHMVIAQDPAY